MLFNFPLSVTDVPAAEKAIEESKVRHGFDEFLSDTLALRHIYRRKLTRIEREDYVRTTLPHVRQYINERIRHVVCADNPLEAHNENPRKTLVYVKEDTVKSLVRAVILDVYGNNIDRKKLRQKETGCMQAIVYVLNTRKEFLK